MYDISLSIYPVRTPAFIRGEPHVYLSNAGVLQK